MKDNHYVNGQDKNQLNENQTKKIIVKKDFTYFKNNQGITIIAGEHELDSSIADWIGQQFHNVTFVDKKTDRKKKS